MRTETPRPADPGKTFDELLLAYLEEVTTTKRAPDRDKWSAKALQPHFTGRALSDIGAAEVRRYIATRKAAGAAPGTVNKEIGLMSAALNWARRELEWDVANPWESRRLREPAGRNRWLTQEEAEGLIAAAETKEEVLELIQEAIEFHLEGIKQDGAPVPQPHSYSEFVEVHA
jgi:predicted RNase H-like HicB family nuclease